MCLFVSQLDCIFLILAPTFALSSSRTVTTKMLSEDLSLSSSTSMLHGAITRVFEKAITEPGFVGLYAKLCLVLSGNLPPVPSADGMCAMMVVDVFSDFLLAFLFQNVSVFLSKFVLCKWFSLSFAFTQEYIVLAILVTFSIQSPPVSRVSFIGTILSRILLYPPLSRLSISRSSPISYRFLPFAFPSQAAPPLRRPTLPPPRPRARSSACCSTRARFARGG
jgi:hypothetical protein